MYHALISPKRAQIVKHNVCLRNCQRLSPQIKRSFSSHNEGELPWQSHQKIQQELENIEIQKQVEHYKKNFAEPKKKAYFDARYSTPLGRYKEEAWLEAEGWRRRLIVSQDAVEALHELEKLQNAKQTEHSSKSEKLAKIRGLWTRFRQFILETKIPLMIDIPKETLEPEKFKKPPIDWNLVVETLNEQLGLYNKKLVEEVKEEREVTSAEIEDLLEQMDDARDLRQTEKLAAMGKDKAAEEEIENEVAEALAQTQAEATEQAFSGEPPKARQKQEQITEEKEQEMPDTEKLSPEERIKRKAARIKKEQAAKEAAEAKKKKEGKSDDEQKENEQQQEREELQDEDDEDVEFWDRYFDPVPDTGEEEEVEGISTTRAKAAEGKPTGGTAEPKASTSDKKDLEKLIPEEIKQHPNTLMRDRYTEQLQRVKQLEKDIEEKIRSQVYLTKAFEQLGIDYHSQMEQYSVAEQAQHDTQKSSVSATLQEQQLSTTPQYHIPEPVQQKHYRAIEIRILEDTTVRDFVASQTFLNPHKATFEEDSIPMQYKEDKSHMQPFGRIVSEKKIVNPKLYIVDEPRTRWDFFKILLQGDKMKENPIFPRDEEPLPKASIIPRKSQLTSNQPLEKREPTKDLFENKFETPPITLPEHKRLIPQRNTIIEEHRSTASKLAEMKKQDDLKELDKERDKLQQIKEEIDKQIAESKKKEEMEVAKKVEALQEQQLEAFAGAKKETDTKRADETTKSDTKEDQGAQKESETPPPPPTPETLFQKQSEKNKKQSPTFAFLTKRLKLSTITGVPKLDPAKLLQYDTYPLGGPYDFMRTSYDENFQKNLKFWFLKYDSLVDFRNRTGVTFKELKHTLRHNIIPELLDSISARDYDKILHYVDDRVLLKWDNDNRWQVPAGITQHSKVLSVGALRVREFLYDESLPMAWMKLTFRALRNRFWMQNGWIVKGSPERLIIDSYAIKICVVFPEAEDPLLPATYSQPRWIVTGLMPRGKRLWTDKPPRKKKRRRRKTRTWKRFQRERRDVLSQFTLNKSLRLFETEEGPVVTDMNLWQRQYQLSPPIHYLYRRFTKACKLGKVDDTLKKMLFPDAPSESIEAYEHTQRALFNIQQAHKKNPNQPSPSQPTIPSSTVQNIPTPSISANPIPTDPLAYTIFEEKRVFEEIKKVKEEVSNYYSKVVDRIFEKRNYLTDPFMDEEEAQAVIADINPPPYLIKWTKQPLDVKKVALLISRMHVIIHKKPFVNETFLSTMLSIHQQHRSRRKEKKEKNFYRNLHLKPDLNKIRNFNPEIMSKIRKVAREKAYEDLQKEEISLIEKRKELAKTTTIPFSPESFEVKKIPDPKSIKFEPYRPGSLFSVTKEGLLRRQHEHYQLPRYGTSEAFVIRNKPKPNFQTEFWKRLEANRPKGPVPWWRPMVKSIETGDPMPAPEMEDEGYSYHIRDWKKIMDQAKRTMQRQKQ